MIEIRTSPEGGFVDLRGPVTARAKGLALAHAEGARFLALPISDPEEGVKWILASFHSPITVVPLPPDLPPDALAQRLKQLPGGTVIFPEQVRVDGGGVNAPPLRNLSDIWAVIFTSGTSGQPKGMALTGVALSASAHAHAQHLGAARASWLLNLPLFHVGGLSVLTRALFLQAPIALSSPRLQAENTLAWIRSGKVGGLSLVPTTLHRLLGGGPASFSELKFILLGGAPAAPELLQLAQEKGAPIHLTYGMTENASQIATEKHPGGGLEPLPGVEVQAAQDGELLIRSPFLASGFFLDGKFSALPRNNGFFATGDLGALSDGRIQIRGRKTNLIITGGKKAFPEELERCLIGLPGLSDAAVTSLPNAEWGEVICAVIVEKAQGSFSIPLAKEALGRSLEGYKIPKRWLFLPKIPRTDSGKIQREALKSAALLASHSQS